jgi:hypothetical protein
MAETEKSATRKPPKGGRRGGTLFPKINLKQALDYSKKVVSKTHTGPQSEQTILPGVFDNAGPTGKVRASALKQYGLLEGAAEAYRATQLARDIDAAPDEDRPPLLQQAFLNSKLFSQMFETFNGDTVSKAKIEQRAKGLGVHPESAGECSQLFIDSAVTASLGTLSGDSISLVRRLLVSPLGDPAASDDSQDGIKGQKKEDPGDERVVASASSDKGGGETGSEKSVNQGTKPGVTLSLTVDPSSDPDKLEKQLKLLRQYGMI